MDEQSKRKTNLTALNEIGHDLAKPLGGGVLLAALALLAALLGFSAAKPLDSNLHSALIALAIAFPVAATGALLSLIDVYGWLAWSLTTLAAVCLQACVYFILAHLDPLSAKVAGTVFMLCNLLYFYLTTHTLRKIRRLENS